MNSDPPAWLTYPRSKVQLSLRRGQERDELDVVCSPQGLGSLAAVFLWLTSFSDHGSMSVSALPFVHVEGALALSVAIGWHEQPFQGQVSRLDKDRQFEWRVYDEQLTNVALQLFRVATNPEYVNYFLVNVGPESDAGLRFEVSDIT